MGEITRIYGSYDSAHAAASSLLRAGFAEDLIRIDRYSTDSNQWSVGIRAYYGTGQAATRILDDHNPVGGLYTPDRSPGLELIARLSAWKSPGLISQLSAYTAPGSISRLSRRKSPGAITRLSARSSPGAISRLSGWKSPGAISRLSGWKSPGAISRLSGWKSPGAISALSGWKSPGAISQLSRTP
jgi:hypothetical protein